MKIERKFIDACWQLVQQQGKMVLVIELVEGDIRAYVVDNFKWKSRDIFQNEVIGGQEVTDLVEGIEMHAAMNNKISIESRIASKPKFDFAFGHDNFLWLKLTYENKY